MRGIAIMDNREGQEAGSLREKFTKYFTSVAGRIDFQDRIVVARPVFLKLGPLDPKVCTFWVLP